jgi:succinate-acetate transporter protein
MGDSNQFVALIIFAIYALIWLAPLLIISKSSKTTGTEKLAWIIAMLFVSWGAFVFYLLLAPLKKR